MDPLALGVLDFCRDIGLPEVEFRDGEVALLIGDHLVTIEIDAPRAEILILAAAGTVDPTEASLRRVLELNHLGVQTDGFTLGLEPGGDLVVLSHRLDAAALRSGRLRQDLDRFVTVLERWAEGFDPPAPEPTDPTETAQPGDWIRL
jgi:hypothetical protein